VPSQPTFGFEHPQPVGERLSRNAAESALQFTKPLRPLNVKTMEQQQRPGT